MGAFALAVDLGASSGRLILGRIENGKIVLREIHRFPNGFERRNGRLCWDVDALYGNIVTGLEKCGAQGTLPATLAIDTWGVDYVLVGRDGKRLGNAVSYRDDCTTGMPRELDKTISPEKLYAVTGVARQPYNTVYQLMANLKSHPEYRSAENRLLFMPCYLNYLLTGVARNEYTIASTSGLLDARTRDWAAEALSAAGIPAELLGGRPAAPGARLGALRPDLAAALGFTCDVVLPACHDTGSACLAVPASGGYPAFLSSGTWSLLGTELDAPDLTENARRAGFTNEGGFGGKIRFLRNIMGLWILQCIRREWENRYTYAQMSALAEKGAAYAETFDPTADRFLAPASMTEEIHAALREAGKPLPPDEPSLLSCVHRSLALCYADAVARLGRLTGKPVTALHIVGGGCQNRTLNRLTAELARIPVYAGPVEGTAIGNLLAQWIAMGELSGVEEARSLVQNSIAPEKYVPLGKPVHSSLGEPR